MDASAALNIIVKVTDSKELNDLLQKQKDFGLSINENAKVARLAEKAYRDMGATVDKEVKESARQAVVALKELKSKGFDETTTANGRMMKSYFQTGEALRVQTAFAGFLQKGMQSLGMETERATRISESFGMSIGMVVGVVGLAIGAIMGLKKAFEMAKVAVQMELLQSTMQQMAAEDGVNFAEILDKINDKVGKMVDKATILQTAMDFSLIGVSWEKLPGVLEFIEQRSKLTGKSFEEMRRALEMAAMGAPKALRTLLMPQDFSPEIIYKKYAESIGAVEKDLSDLAKKQALFNAILEEGKNQHLKINDELAKEQDKYESLETAWKNLGTEAGKLATAMSPVVSVFADILRSLNDLLHFDYDKMSKNLQKARSESNKRIDEQRARLGLPPRQTYVTEKSPKQLQEEANAARLTQGIGNFVDVPEMGLIDAETWEKMKKRQQEEAQKAGEEARKAFLDGISARSKAFTESLQGDKTARLISGLPGLVKRGNREDEWEKGLKGERPVPMPEARDITDRFTKELAQMSDGLSKTNVIIDIFYQGINGVTQGLRETFTSLIDGSKNLGQAVWDLGKTIVNTVVQIAAESAAKGIMGGILSIFGLSRGGDVLTSGSSLQFAAKGGTFNPGSNVIVGERGPELMQVGRNGVRVISNNNLRQMNQISAGGSGNNQLLKAINNLHIVQKTSSRGMSTMVLGGNRVLEKNTY